MGSQRVGHEWGFPGGSEVKASASDVGDLGSIPGFDPWVGKILWRRKWQLQYSCLENPVDRGTWGTIVHSVAKKWIRLSN